MAPCQSDGRWTVSDASSIARSRAWVSGAGCRAVLELQRQRPELTNNGLRTTRFYADIRIPRPGWRGRSDKPATLSHPRPLASHVEKRYTGHLKKGNLRTLRGYLPGQPRRRRDRHPAGTWVSEAIRSGQLPVKPE